MYKSRSLHTPGEADGRGSEVAPGKRALTDGLASQAASAPAQRRPDPQSGAAPTSAAAPAAAGPPASAAFWFCDQSAADPVQAKLGFEVEMKVLLSKHLNPMSHEESAYGDPGNLYRLGRSGQFDVVVDHGNGISGFVNTNGRPAYNSIIELRTDAIDESMVGRDDAAQPLEQAAAFAEQIEQRTGNFQHRIPLKDVLPGADEDLTLGWERQMSDVDFMSTDGDVQATFGIKLAQVPALIRELAAQQPQHLAPQSQPPQGHKELLATASAAARGALKEAFLAPSVRQRLTALRSELMLLKQQVDTGKRQGEVNLEMQEVTKTGLSEAAYAPYQELEGLTTLICMYLVAGQSMRDNGQLDKNMVPLLVRHQLAELYATLAPTTVAQLADPLVRQALKQQLLSKTARGADEFLLPTRPSSRDFGGNVQDFKDHNKCGEWIDRVLTGDVRPVTLPTYGLTDDISSYFGKMRKIAPEEVGPQRYEPGIGEPLPRDRGVVMEQRMMTGAVPRGQWGSLARRYYDLLREQNSIQRKGAAEGDAPTSPASADPGPGQALPEPARRTLEAAFGAELSSLRVHVGGAAPALGALAFAQGEQLHFAPGQYDPNSARGLELLGHEVAHVIQQRQGRVGRPQGQGAPINGDAALEAEADAAGAAVAAGQPVPSALASSKATEAPLEGAPQQRKVGFEIEVNVLLSKSGPSTAPGAQPEAGELGARLRPGRDDRALDVVTGEELRKGCYGPSSQLASKYGTRTVWATRKDNGKLIALRWDPGTVAVGPGIIRPNDVGAEEPGRWVWIKDWDPETQPNQHVFDPLLGKSQKVFHATAGTPFDVVEDHVPTPLAGELGSIIELVTDPREEQVQTGEDPVWVKTRFLEPVRRAVETVGAIKSATGSFSKRIPANSIFAGARPDLYLGHDGMSGQNDMGSLQATFGIRLGGVRQLMQERAEGGSMLKEPEILLKAMKAASAASNELGWSEQRTPGLCGLLHLVAMYLVAGHLDYKHLCSLDKNHVPFLIRHGLPALRAAQLTGAERSMLAGQRPKEQSSSEIFSMVFDYRGGFGVEEEEADLFEIVARAAGRTPSERLFAFSDSNLTVREWLRAVLYEESDPLMKDFWGEAKEIAPESVGRQRHEPGTGEPLPREEGAILEQRHVSGGYEPPTRWEEIAESFFDKVQRYNR